MTWARLDDQTSTQRAWLKIGDVALQSAAAEPGKPAEIAERARVAAARAKAVHLVTLMWAVPALSDGRVSPAGVDQICAIGSLTAAEWYDAAELLAAAGAWRRVKPSKREPMGAYQMLLGWAPGEQPTAEEDRERRARARLRDGLRDGGKDYPSKLIAVTRSGGMCEYCGVELGASGGQIDHVDPNLLTNDPENLAHACAKCNKTKSNHTLDAAGMSFTSAAVAARKAWSKTSKTGKEQR
jgi:5-methylcytosine-specific restriction endonuclease McrA